MAPTMSPTQVPVPQPNSLDAGILPLDAWLHLRVLLRLSDRELQIVQGIFAGQEQDGIANSLALPPDLVYRTIQRIFIKMHIGSRIELRSRVRSEYLAFAATRNAEKAFHA